MRLPAVALTLLLAVGSAAAQALPLGDGHVTDHPQVGNVYTCASSFRGGGARHAGPWIHGATWSPNEKPHVMGRVMWPQARFSLSQSGGAYYMLVQRDVHDPATGTNVQGMCVLRTATPGDPTSWRAWDGSGFNMRFVDPYRGATIEPAAHTCRLVSPGQVGALTYSLTYNTYLGAFLALGVRGDGFYYALSNDLLHWTQPKRVMAAVQGFANGGQTPYYAYPSIVDPDSQSRNFDTSGRTPYLYYTRVNSLDPLDFDLLRVRVAFQR